MKILKRLSTLSISLSLFISSTPLLADDYSYNASNCAEAKRNLRNIQKEQFSLKGKKEHKKNTLSTITIKHDQYLAQIMVLRGLKEMKEDFDWATTAPPEPQIQNTNKSFQKIKKSVQKRLSYIKKVMAVEMIIKDDMKKNKQDTQEKYIDNLGDRCAAQKLKDSYKQICGLLDLNLNKVSQNVNQNSKAVGTSNFTTIVKGFYKLYHHSLDGMTKTKREELSQTYLKVLMDTDPTLELSLQEIYTKNIKDQNIVKKGFESIVNKINSIEKNIAVLDKDKQINKDKVTKLYESLSLLQNSELEKKKLNLTELNEIKFVKNKKKASPSTTNRSNQLAKNKRAKGLLEKLNNYTIALGQRHPRSKNLDDFVNQIKPTDSTKVSTQLRDSIKNYLTEVGCKGFNTLTKNFSSGKFSSCMQKIEDIDLDKKIKDLNLERKKWAKNADAIRKKPVYKSLNVLKQYAASEYRYNCEKASKELTDLTPFQTCHESQGSIHSKELRTFVDEFGNLVANIKDKILHHKSKNYLTLQTYYAACLANAGQFKNLQATRKLCGDIKHQLDLKKKPLARKAAIKKAYKLHEDYDIYGSNGRTVMTKHKSKAPEIASMVIGGGAYAFQTYSGYRNLSYTLPGIVDYLMSVKSANAFKKQYYGGYDPFAFGLGNYNGVNVYGLQAQNLLFAAGTPQNLSSVDIGDTDQYKDNEFNPGSVDITGGDTGGSNADFNTDSVQISN